MPRINKSRLSRIDSRLNQRFGGQEDIGIFLERIACSDSECFELCCDFALAMNDHPHDQVAQVAAWDRFFDRVEVVMKLGSRRLLRS